MGVKTINNLSKNEKVAVFVAVSVAIVLFIIPSFDFFSPAPQSLTFVEEALTRTDQLSIYELKHGNGQSAKDGDVLFVHYEGKFTDGVVFDASYSGEPFRFTLGRGEVILGWDVGLQGMKEGATRILVIPPNYGYGREAIGPIPANSTLVFDIELLEIERPEQ